MNIAYRTVGKWDEYEKLENIAFLDVKTDKGEFTISLENNGDLRVSGNFQGIVVKPRALNSVYISFERD